MNKKIIFILAIFLSLAVSDKCKAERSHAMKLSSPEFKHNTFIPAKFTCQGEGVNPALTIEGIPAQAKSLALIMNDPDAMKNEFVHWVVYDIPVTGRIEENSIPGKQGVNSLGEVDYVPPCPPVGVHHYFFKVYALDNMLNLEGIINKVDLENAIGPHILDKAELVGLYKKR